jgi:hypothetical protein
MEEKQRVIENDFSEGCLFEPYKEQIAKIKAWGRTFIALKSEHVYHSPEVLKEDGYFNEYLREEISESIFAVQELPFRCSVGVLSDDYGTQYIGILNRDYERMQTFSLPLKRTSRIYEVSCVDGNQHILYENAECITVTLAEGDMVFYRIQNIEEEPYEIEYVCCEK